MLDTKRCERLEGRASAVVTGDSGSGKTCLLRALEDHLPPGRHHIHYLHNATMNRRDFYRQLSIAMGMAVERFRVALRKYIRRRMGVAHSLTQEEHRAAMITRVGIRCVVGTEDAALSNCLFWVRRNT
jgi:ABC-type phosphate/phosphonate transport system ATPase subunit